MQRDDLLIEIGTEELPPTALKTLAIAFSDNIQQGLTASNISFSDAKWFATPRRLAVYLSAAQGQQDDVTIEKRGPAVSAAFDQDGNPTKAALGWARGNGIDITEAKRLVTDKGEWLLHNALIKGKSISEILATVVESALQKLPIPKPMRWGNSDVQFIRPVKTICMLYGNDLIPGKVFNIESSRVLQGHRFHGAGQLTIDEAKNYETAMHNEYVVVDYNKRQQLIEQQVQTHLTKLDAVADINAELLDEVTALVEWPVTLQASFDERFLQVPKEALIYTMKGDQKYFPLLDNNGQLLPLFLFVTNIESTDPAQIVSGNEKVIRPRLADAEFFFNTDKKQTLESRLTSLESVLFQKQLGTLKAKSERIATLSAFVAAQIGADAELAARAGLLSKTDLMTEMVMEFTDIQGTMGMHYARIDGEDEAVAVAMDEQYKPRFSGDTLPQGMVSCAVAIADKLDTLTGIFGIGQIPKGDRDPFALRRAAIGLLRIIQQHNLPLQIENLVSRSAELFADVLSNDTVVEDVVNFIFSRYKNLYTEKGIDGSIIQSVLVRRPMYPADFDARVIGVGAFRQLPETDALAAANKRVANILAKNSDDSDASIDQNLFDNDVERNLFSAITDVESVVKNLVTDSQYGEALATLAKLQVPIDSFFDNVMVMAEDIAVKQNRLALLKKIRGMFLQIADISELS